MKKRMKKRTKKAKRPADRVTVRYSNDGVGEPIRRIIWTSPIPPMLIPWERVDP